MGYIDDVVGVFDAVGGLHFLLQDANYNVVGATDTTGELVQQYSFEPYGERYAVESVSGAVATPIDWKANPEALLADFGH